MKKTFVLIIAFLVSLTTNIISQNSTSTYKVYSDDQNIELKTKDSMVVFLSINGKTISKNNYGKYQDLIDSIKYCQPETPVPHEPEVEDIEQNDNDVLTSQITSYLIDAGELKNLSKYKIKLNDKSLELDGKTLNKDHHLKLIEIFERVKQRDFTSKTSIKIKVKRGNKSTSIIEKGHSTVDKDIEF